jgi:hypothetical protein
VTTAIFNPNPRIELLQLSTGSVCLTIDDALLDPEELVRAVMAGRELFAPVDINFYPGVVCAAPERVAAALAQFFNQHIRRYFDARRLLQMHCRVSMVTSPPQNLEPIQSLCHRDRTSLDPRHSIQASVLYLFRDPDLGGTSFYEARQQPEQTDALFRDAVALERAQFFSKYGLQPGYLTGSNRYFTRIGRVHARWNRLIFFDGSHLHSGDITAPERLSADPASGRLTLNGFFTSRRHLR